MFFEAKLVVERQAYRGVEPTLDLQTEAVEVRLVVFRVDLTFVHAGVRLANVHDHQTPFCQSFDEVDGNSRVRNKGRSTDRDRMMIASFSPRDLQTNNDLFGRRKVKFIQMQ